MSKEPCPFCEPPKKGPCNDLAYVRYDKYPVSAGHTLIVPYRHVSDYFKLTEQEEMAIIALLWQMKDILREEYNPTGFNVGVNVGTDAGQTIGHVHMHLIPRYAGDMKNPAGGVRGVIPEKQKY